MDAPFLFYYALMMEGCSVRVRAISRIRVCVLVSVALALTGCGLLGFGAKTAKVVVKFDQAGGDNSFAATVYVQEVDTGDTLLFPYDPHTPNITVDLKKPGKYVFYARLIEARRGSAQQEPGCFLPTYLLP
jgi:hypothetical protein